MKFFLWILKLTVAGILLQTLFFKFTGAAESVYIFSTLGVEPFGRYFAGLSELIASILILVPALSFLGAAMAIGIMLGAIMSHLAILGIVIQNDGGLLFGLACLVLALSFLVLFFERSKVYFWVGKFKGIAPAKN